MGILNIQIESTGLSGVRPAEAYLETNDPVATVLTAGYLNHAVQQGYSFPIPCMALVSTKQTPTSQPELNWYSISHSGANWSLILPGQDSGGVVLPTIVDRIATYTNTTGTISEDADVAANNGDIQAGGFGTAGELISANTDQTLYGDLRLAAAPNSGNFRVAIANANHAQSSTYTIPDTGVGSAKFVMDHGTNASATFTAATITTATIGTMSGNTTAGSFIKLSSGATPVPLVDPASCTISATAGATNTAIVSIQIKDGSGANIIRNIPFKVYASNLADGSTIASPASTGFALLGSGTVFINGSPVTTQINGMTNASGQAVLSLLDTAKQTSYLVLVLDNGIKISAQLTTGSYG